MAQLRHKPKRPPVPAAKSAFSLACRMYLAGDREARQAVEAALEALKRAGLREHLVLDDRGHGRRR